MFQKIRIRTKRAAVALFAVALMGTGLLSTAALTDTLQVQNSWDIASINLQASPDGTTFSESAALTWPGVKTGIAYEAYKKLQIKNSGNNALDFTVALSAAGTTGFQWTSFTYDMAKVASGTAACDATTIFSSTTRLTGKASAWNIADATATTATEHMNAPDTLFVCIKATATSTVTGAMGGGDHGALQVTLAATAS